MARGRRLASIIFGAAVTIVLLGAAVLDVLRAPHPGETHYQKYCSECHDRDGVISMIEQRADEAERLFGSAHISHHIHHPEEHAELIAFLRQETGR